VLLTGFGCTSADVRESDRRYRVGSVPVSKPSGGGNRVEVTGDVASCYGDSGGAAFFPLNKEGSRRVQVGINERGNLSTSYLTSLSSHTVQSFLGTWRTALGVKVCGLDPGVDRCRP